MTTDATSDHLSPDPGSSPGGDDAVDLGPEPAAETPTEETPGFAVRLDNFEGPFDLLLSLIAKHKLDITEVALSKVTDEFIAHIKAGGPEWDLEQTTSFLLVASTLLDLKAARLLPQGDVEDEEDLALLEARDLLFARLLQYRAFKQVAAVIERRMHAETRRHPRAVGLEERYAGLLPEVLIGLGLDEFAALAAKAMAPKPALELSLSHIHAPTVSVKEQAGVVVDRLRRGKTLTFRALAGDAPDTLTRVARFLALLELFREGAVSFDQVTPLGELTVRWTGSEEGEVEIHDEFDGTTSEGGLDEGGLDEGGPVESGPVESGPDESGADADPDAGRRDGTPAVLVPGPWGDHVEDRVERGGTGPADVSRDNPGDDPADNEDTP